MLGRRKLKALRDVAEVRGLQRLAAEMRASRQTARLRALEQDLTVESEGLAHLCEGWERVIEIGVLDPVLAKSWASAVDSSFGLVAATQGEVDNQAAISHQANAAWRLAREQAKAAEARSRSATRRAGEHRDERIFDEICERQLDVKVAP